MEATATRKWTAQIVVDGEVIPAANSKNDLLNDQTFAACREAGEWVKAGADDVRVILFKQLTGDAAPVRDRSFYVFDTPKGIRYQGLGK